MEERECIIVDEQKDIVSSIIKILLASAFIYVWGLILFYPDNISPEFVIPNTYIFIGVFIIAIISAKLSAKHQANFSIYSGKLYKENFLLFIASVFLLGMQLFITWNIVFRTSWDPGAVWYGAKYAALNDIDGMFSMSEYFSFCPNNLLLVYIYSRILKLNILLGEHVSNGILLLAMFQCVLLTITGVLVFKCARHYVSVKTAWVAYLLYVVLVGLSAWMVIPYSDSTGAIFPILLLGLYIKMKGTNVSWKRYGLLFSMVCFSYIGFRIKPMAIIVLIAVGSMELINWIRKCIKEKRLVKIKQVMCTIAVVAVAFLLTFQLIVALISQMQFHIDSQRQFGWQHYLMIGANPQSNGGYSDGDLAFSSGIMDSKMRNAENLRVFQERMKEMGVSGYIDLFAKKAAKNYFNGTFGWGGIGDSFYTEIYAARENKFCHFLRSWYYDNDAGNLYQYNALFRQVLWFFVLVTIPFMAIAKRHLRDTEKVLVVSVLGLMLYLQLFEFHARYLFTFVPLFCILAMCGYETLRGMLKKNHW